MKQIETKGTEIDWIWGNRTCLQKVPLETVPEGALVFVGGRPDFSREGDEWCFAGLASPSEGGVRYGPDSTLYESPFVWVPVSTQ